MIELLTDVSLVTLDLDEESSFSPVSILQSNDGIVESWQIASMLYPLAGAFSCSVLSQPAVKGMNIFTARARYSPRAGDILFDQ